MTNSTENINQFYQQLDSTLRTISPSDKIMLMGDFNARVGQDYITWPKVLEKYGCGKLNSNGEFLLTLCTEHQLAITNTFFNHKPAHKNSWMHSRSKHWHLIDYIIILQRDLVDILDTRAMRGANCSTDHIMIRSITKFKVRRKMMKGRKSNYKLNISRIKNRQVQEKLEKTLTERLDTIPPGDAENKWQAFKEVVCNASEEHLGIATKKQEDWFDENSAELVQLLDARNQARTNMLNRNTRSNKAKFKTHSKLLQNRC
ncbi:craniofacial development protein 2-like [Anneissia japonica]|uniref:craniofacial development protein 2-like n=1 Tax=Anneissia japonica TaxID=1529436 RepID=UPI001425AB84|nr:craniofacial development protein 2-like [Anneissia japonica]